MNSNLNDYENRVDLSVLLLTCNHEMYLEKSIESVLKQETRYSYELLIGVDYSVDKTLEIARKYAKLYSNITVIERNCTETLDLISKMRTLSKGQFIGILEGDDYWLSTHKIDIQVRFLSENSNFIGCCHKFMIVDQSDNEIKNYSIARYTNKEVYTRKDMEKGKLPSQTSTLMYRNVFRSNRVLEEDYSNCNSIGDMKIAMVLSLLGNVYVMNEKLGVYRYVNLAGESWSARTTNQNLALKYWEWMDNRIVFAEKCFSTKLSYCGLKCSIIYYSVIYFAKKPSLANLQIVCKLIMKDHNIFNLICVLLRLTITPFRVIGKILRRI